MPFKELSRHTLLTTSSALAFPHTPFARALSARQSANTNDYNPYDRIASFKQVFSEGQTVVIPDGLVCDNISIGIFTPPSKTLCILGGLRGSGRGRFVLQDGSQVAGGEGGSTYNIILGVCGSDYTIKGLAMSGFGLAAQIYIGGKNERIMRNPTVDSLIAGHANCAILRQGFHNQIIGANAANCKFNDLQGDTIEWNVAISDRDILISDHVIERINCANGKINWGIDIGLTGSTYDNNCPEGRTVKNFVVVNITGSDCRQLIYVEDGKHFIVRNIKTRDITPDFNEKTGIDSATVAIYGCDNFVIDNIGMISNAGTLVDYEVAEGKHLSIPQNFRINNIRLDNTHLAYRLRDIQISVGNAVPFVVLANTEMKRASLGSHNKPQHLSMHNISVMQEPSVGPTLDMNSDIRKDVRGVFTAKKEALLSPTNVHTVSERGQSSVDIDRVNHHIVNMEKISFRLPEWRE